MSIINETHLLFNKDFLVDLVLQDTMKVSSNVKVNHFFFWLYRLQIYTFLLYASVNECYSVFRVLGENDQYGDMFSHIRPNGS